MDPWQRGERDERELLSDFNRVFEMGGQRISSGRFCHTIKVAAGNHHYYIKRYQVRLHTFGRLLVAVDLWSRLVILPTSHGWASCAADSGIRKATVTRPVHPWRHRYRRDPQTVDFQTLFRTRADLWKNRSWLFQALRLIANYVRRIHEDGFTHGDLKWRNILVTTTDAPCVFFIDCPSGGRKSFFRRRHFVIKDLAGLDRPAAEYLSRTTRLRFYLWYRNQTRLTQEDKALIARVTTSEG